VSRSPDEVQAEIERTRHQLANTLDQLVQRTSPKRLADEAKTTVLDTLKTPAGKAVVGAVGAGVALLVALRIRRHFAD
jgi:hypothetical protein